MRTIIGVTGKIPRPTPALGVAFLALLIACSGAAVASIPSTDGTITACRDNKSGSLRVIDTQKSQACKASETLLAWKDGITGKVADALHADRADSAASAGDADTLDGEDSTRFANSSHTHSGGDITSGTVDADRIEDGSGSGLDADTLDGFNSSDLQRRVSASCDPGSAIQEIGEDGTVTCEPDDTGAAQDMAPLPAVKARSSNLVVENDTHTPLELTFEDLDQVGEGQTFGITEMHRNTPNNYEFVAPRAGIYEVQVEVIWGSSSYGASGAGERRVTLRKNWVAGTCGEGSFDDMDVQYADPTDRLTSHISTLLAMNPGDNVFFCGYQTSGEPLGVDFVFASMHYVSSQ